ncbi:hypothetical protein H632_c93p2 [Helicosporidium sp. ATCC 50920]|nr:hypothetical protein H632_c93p2 [Helicosporidium sp. ATCC 50920]|eukprot:KDD76830.1 hypothetical protein H632_c93p2 [Helicosporidium sp. ATCC 50920]
MVVKSTVSPSCAAALRASLEPSILASLSSVERPARVDWAVVVEDSLALDPPILQSVFDMHISHRPLGEALLSVIAVPEASSKPHLSTAASDDEGYVQVLARLATEESAPPTLATCRAVTASAAKQLAALVRDMLVPEPPGPCIRDALHSLLAAKELLDPSYAFQDTPAKARALDRAAAALLRAAGLAERGDSVDSRSAAQEAWQTAQGVMQAGDAGVVPHFPPEHGAAAALPVLLPIGVVLLQHTLKLAVQMSRRSA